MVKTNDAPEIKASAPAWARFRAHSTIAMYGSDVQRPAGTVLIVQTLHNPLALCNAPLGQTMGYYPTFPARDSYLPIRSIARWRKQPPRQSLQ